ncbi:MAG: hypothetical protein IKY91_01730, partial [Akkermansia sp.]|nr:hypothetical protein [Akkermansia sp.]
MDIKIDKTSDCQATLTAIATPAEVTAIKDAAINAFAKNARIPGFRPGKAPKSVIAKRFAEGIADELDARIKADVQDQALEENPELKVLDFGTPTTSQEEDGSYKLVSTLTIVPEFELPEYMGIEVSIPTDEVSDDEVQDTLQKYAESSAEHVVVERASAKGDIVV